MLDWWGFGAWLMFVWVPGPVCFWLKMSVCWAVGQCSPGLYVWRRIFKIMVVWVVFRYISKFLPVRFPCFFQYWRHCACDGAVSSELSIFSFQSPYLVFMVRNYWFHSIWTFFYMKKLYQRWSVKKADHSLSSRSATMSSANDPLHFLRISRVLK